MMQSEIILYSTGCPRCNVIRKKLDAKNISYVVNNSVEDMESLGIANVPVLQVNGELLDFLHANQWINTKG